MEHPIQSKVMNRSGYWEPGKDKPDKRINKIENETNKNKNVYSSTKSSLSSKTLSMKFMKRKIDNEIEINKVYAFDTNDLDEDDPEEMKNAIQFFTDVPDPSLDGIFGRRSFKGFNQMAEREYPASLEHKNTREMADIKNNSSKGNTTRIKKYVGLKRSNINLNSNQRQKNTKNKKKKKVMHS